MYEKDGGQCTFVSASGKRCDCREGLHIDHILALAKGGKTELSNLQLLCAAHNQYKAEQEFGPGYVEGRRERARRERAEARLARQRESARQVGAAGRPEDVPSVAESEAAGARAASEAGHAAAAALDAERAVKRQQVQCALEGFRIPAARAKRLAATANLELPILEAVRAILKTLAPPNVRRIAPATPESSVTAAT